MYLSEKEIYKFRESTERCASTPGIQFNTRYCHKCGLIKSSQGGKIIKGSSRHNPNKFFCVDCK